jgi:hypothetical protein
MGAILTTKSLQDGLAGLRKALGCRARGSVAVARAVQGILEFLCSPSNDNDENCASAGHFILLDLLEDPEIKAAVSELPDELGLIIEDMGSFLDDVHTAPDIARNFESTPQQLLERLRKLQNGLEAGL